MNLQFYKIKKDTKRFINILEEKLPLLMNTNREIVIDIFFDKDKLNIKYINNFNDEITTIVYDGKEDLYENHLEKSTNDLYKFAIADIIKNYKDKTEEEYHAELIRVDELLEEDVYIYKTKSGFYLYAFKNLEIMADKDGLKNIYKNNKEIKRKDLNSIEKTILKDTLILNKKLISKEMNIPKININGEEYINIELIKNNIENSKIYKKDKDDIDRLYFKGNKLINLFLFCFGFLTLSSFGIVFSESQKTGLISFISFMISFGLAIFATIKSEKIISKNEKLKLKNSKNQAFLEEIKDELYIRKKYVEEILKEYEIPDISYQSTSIKDEIVKTKKRKKSETLKNPFIDYSIRCNRSKGINALLRELEKRGLDRNYPLIYSYYIPEVIEFENMYDSLNEENKREVEKSIKLLENKLKEILDEDNRQNNIEFKAKMEAFNNSFK